MSLLNKTIEEVIQTLFNSIKSKKKIIKDIKNEFDLNNMNNTEITLSRLKLIDLLDEFDITISQSLQAIQTLQAEIFNLKENILDENNLIDFNKENYNNNIINLNEENFNKNDLNNNNIKNNLNKNNNKKNNILNTIEKNKEKEEIKNEISIINENVNRTNQMINSIILNETKLNFDYSKLAEQYNNDNYNNKENNNNNELLTINLDEKINKEPDLKINKNKIKIQNNYEFEYDNKNNIEKNNNEKKNNSPNLSGLLINYTNEPEPEEEHSKIPIRQSLKNLSKNHSNYLNNNNINNTINSIEKPLSIFLDDDNLLIEPKKEFSNKNNKIKKIKNIQFMLKKIENEEKFKLYLGKKFGNGNYENLVKNIKDFEKNNIDINDLEKELNIIIDLMKSNIEENIPINHKINKKIINNSSNNILKNYNRENSIKKSNSTDEYKEPINFANFLRGGDGSNLINARKNKNNNINYVNIKGIKKRSISKNKK
jgi:hypothetical protein